MTYLIKYLFQIKKDLNLSVFNMITRINEWKVLIKEISCKCKKKSMEKNVTRINVDVNVRNVMYGRKIIFAILQHVVVKIEYT